MKPGSYVFSLVVPTIYRTAEVGALLESIACQELKNFALGEIEVLVVDQNQDGRLDAILKDYGARLSIKHLKIQPRGLSNARNAGLAEAKGRFVAFPDDDCHYAPDTLEKVYGFFKETGNEFGLFIRAQDPLTKIDFLKYPSEQKLIRSPRDGNVFLGVSISQFYSAEMLSKMGMFDEKFGIGGQWGSGEETDFAIRCLKTGYPIQFRPDILVCHPLVVSDNMERAKLRKYAVGFGALCRKQGLYGLMFLKALKQMAGMFFFTLKFDLKSAANCRVILSGRAEGFWKYGRTRDEKSPG